METEIVLTSIFLLVLVVTSTAKSALDELSDVSLRRLATEAEGTPLAPFWSLLQDQYHQISFTLTFGLHFAIAAIAILVSSLAQRRLPDSFLVVAFGAMIGIVMIFRLILPLLVTQNDPERMLLRLRIPLLLLFSGLGIISNPIYRLVRRLQRDETEQTPVATETSQSEDNGDLQALLDVGEEEGIIEEEEGEMIQSIIRFSDRTVVEVMTPRPRIVAVEATTTVEQVRDLMIESKYSRLPVYRDQIDQIEGVIYVRDLLRYWAAAENDRPVIEVARRQLYEVPESKPIDDLLREMQKAKVQMALVIDEYGGIAGLVTLEDLIEEIVGEIEDEDEPEPIADEAEIVQLDDESYLVRGDVEVGKLERIFEVQLATDDFITVAGLVLNQLGHLPTVGEEIDLDSLRFQVMEADQRRISRLRVQRLALPLPEEGSPAGLAPPESSPERK
ncbi:MAG: hemolysin family protein [Blastocatellia bacterium]